MTTDLITSFTNLGAAGVLAYIVYYQVKNYRDLAEKMLIGQENSIKAHMEFLSVMKSLQSKIEEDLEVGHEVVNLLQDHHQTSIDAIKKVNEMHRTQNEIKTKLTPKTV